MNKDVGERVNESSSHPEVVAQLTKLLEKHVADGRSTAGKPQTNDVVVNIRKAKALSKDDEGKVITHD